MVFKRVSEEIPRPSSGVQPPRPSATSMSHVENKNELALVPVQSYHARDEPSTSKSLGYQPKGLNLNKQCIVINAMDHIGPKIVL